MSFVDGKKIKVINLWGLKLVITLTAIVRNDYYTIKYAFEKNDVSERYAVKCISRNNLTEKDITNLQNEFCLLS